MATTRTTKVSGPLKAYMKFQPNGGTIKRVLLRRNVDEDTYDRWVFDDPTIDPLVAENINPLDPRINQVGNLNGQWVPHSKAEVQAILGQ